MLEEKITRAGKTSHEERPHVSCTDIYLSVSDKIHISVHLEIYPGTFICYHGSECKHLPQLTVIRIPQSKKLACLAQLLSVKDFGVSPSSETGKFITCVQCVDKPKLLYCNTGQTPLLLRSEPNFCDFGS